MSKKTSAFRNQKGKHKSIRPEWDEFWFSLALFYSTRGTCDRLRAACVIVDKNKRLVGAGYNGSLAGDAHCDEVGHFIADGHCIRTLHAEVNAILHSMGDLQGATAYLIGTPCVDCTKKLLSKGIKKILYTREYDNKSRGGQYIFELAKSQGAVVKKCDVNLADLVAKNMHVLKGPGGALKS